MSTKLDLPAPDTDYIEELLHFLETQANRQGWTIKSVTLSRLHDNFRLAIAERKGR